MKRTIIAAALLATVVTAQAAPMRCGTEFDGRAIPCNETPAQEAARNQRYTEHQNKQAELAEKAEACRTITKNIAYTRENIARTEVEAANASGFSKIVLAAYGETPYYVKALSNYTNDLNTQLEKQAAVCN